MVKLELEALGFEVNFATVEVHFVLCVFTAGMCVCLYDTAVDGVEKEEDVSRPSILRQTHMNNNTRL